MKITKRQLRRIIKETHPDYQGLPQSDIDYYELADDYTVWVEDFGHGAENPSHPGVMASYFLEKGLEDDHEKHEMLGKAFRVKHDDIMKELELQSADQRAAEEILSTRMGNYSSSRFAKKTNEGTKMKITKSRLRRIIKEELGSMTVDKRDQLMDALESKYGLKARTTEDFGSGSGGVWLSGESDVPETAEGLPMFDYYLDMDPYEFGVHPDFVKFVGEYGFFPEWNDPGTLMLWRM